MAENIKSTPVFQEMRTLHSGKHPIEASKSNIKATNEDPSQTQARARYQSNGPDQGALTKSKGSKFVLANSHLSTSNGPKHATCPQDKVLLTLLIQRTCSLAPKQTPSVPFRLSLLAGATVTRRRRPYPTLQTHPIRVPLNIARFINFRFRGVCFKFQQRFKFTRTTESKQFVTRPSNSNSHSFFSLIEFEIPKKYHESTGIQSPRSFFLEHCFDFTRNRVKAIRVEFLTHPWRTRIPIARFSELGIPRSFTFVVLSAKQRFNFHESNRTVGRSSMADSDNDSGGAHNAGGNAQGSELSPREQDRFLPIANVSRIMKKALPANAKISKDAKETVQECVSEFISFITGEASDKCQREKRKTINGDDLLWAMTTLGFEDYVEPLKVYLQRFREMEGEKSVAARDKDAPPNANSPFESGSYGGGMMMHQGHVYGSGGFHQVAVTGGSTLMGKGGPGYPGPGSNAGRPR
ncbi:hypothetical protein SESBI_01379 [Sesbania bispinosa]|nr:hypothetical protein SESBI_01379 [Sesbania bispinosa]